MNVCLAMVAVISWRIVPTLMVLESAVAALQDTMEQGKQAVWISMSVL